MGGVKSLYCFQTCTEAVKSQPCCKRNGNSISRDLFHFFSNSSWSNGQPPPEWAHLCWVPGQATIKKGMKTFQRKI